MTKRNEACSTLTILRNRQKADNASINHPAFAAVELTDAVHRRTVNENHHIGILLMVSDSRKSESNGILSACSSTLRDNCAGRKTGMFSSLANSLAARLISETVRRRRFSTLSSGVRPPRFARRPPIRKPSDLQWFHSRSTTAFSNRSLRTVFCRDSIPFRSRAKSEGICLLFKIKGYLCIVVGNRPRETLQNGAVFRWSNRGRKSLLPKYNSKIYRHLIA